MHIYNKIHFLLSTVSYIFRRLSHQLQGELYHVLKIIVALIAYGS
jgi:hypothetical protein